MSGAGSDGISAQEAAGLRDIRGHRAGVGHLPAGQVPRPGQLPQALALRHAPHRRHDRVIGQVPAHAGAVGEHRDVVLAQVRGRADTGQHQQLRAADGASREDHLGVGPGRLLDAAAQVADAGRPAALDVDAGHQGVGLHGEIRPADGRVQVGVGRRPAPPAPLSHLVVPDAILAGAVEVVVAGLAAVLRGADEGAGQVALVAQILHAQRSGRPVVGRRAPGVALGPQEVGQQVGIAPALAAVVVPPGVVVDPVAADVDHRVDRRRAAEDLAPRPVHRAAAGPVLLGRLVVPVEGRLEQQVDGGRDVDLVRGVRRPGFEQQYPGVRILGQPRGKHAAGAAGADNDVVVHGHTFPGLGPRADEYPTQPRAQLGWRCSRKPAPRVSAYRVNYGQLSRFRDVHGDFRRLVARRSAGHSATLPQQART